jgi:hypothetical protein
MPQVYHDACLKYTLPYTHLLSSLIRAILQRHITPPTTTSFKTILSSALGLPTLDIGGRKVLTTSHSPSLISLNLIQNELKKGLNSFETSSNSKHEKGSKGGKRGVWLGTSNPTLENPEDRKV